MHKKRIVHLISSLKIGGAESWLIDLLDHLPKGYEHHVVYFHGGPNHDHLLARGIATYQVQPSFYSPFFYLKLYKLLKKINPDLMHSSLWSANFTGRLIAHLLHKPLISTLHLGIDEDGPIRNLIDRYTLGYAQHMVAVSDVVAQTLKDHQGWLKKKPYSLIKNGINPAPITTTLTRKELGVPSNAFVIGSVGRFIARKNYPWLIECFAEIHACHPHAHLLLLGLGPEESIIKKRINDFGLNQAITIVTGKQALPFYPLMDCFIQPSKQEGLSIALLEAMRAQLPCIATSVNGKHDALIHEENGLIIPLTQEAVITACSRIIMDQSLRYRLGVKARQDLVEHYSSMAMAQNYEKLYRQYLNR